nr:hypothetical protein [Fodinibius sp.]NIY28985.1 hypothetical protein [Fodinibius sp.]
GKLLDFTEEGLATVAAGLVAAMLAGGSRFLSDQFSTDQFWRGIKTGFPRNYTDAAELITLAASSMATNKKTTGKILNGWVRNGGVGTERAILDTLKKEFEFDDEDFEHMLENSDVNYKLFNPYHDERGRFTTKEGNRYFSGSEAYSKDVKDMEGTIESAAKKNKFGKPNIFFFGKQSDYAKEVCRDMGRSDRSCRNYVGKNTYAAHRGGKVYISQALLAMHKRDRDGANYLGVHEVFHSRKRKGGGRGCKVFKNKYDNSTVTIVEEGITDMLARRFTGLPYNRGVGGEKPPYRGHMGALAFLALNATGGNRDAAWKLLNDIHYDIDNLSNINNLLSKSFIGADGKSKTKWSQKDRYGAINNLVNHPEYGERALAILFGG